MLINQDFTHDRTKYLGGSDIGAIFGLSKYRSPLDVWMEKTGKATNEVNNLPIRFGTFAEEFVASEYASTTGYQVAHQLEPITHPQHDYLQGHIDRFVFAKDSRPDQLPTHVLECKTANPFARSEWGEVGSDEVPMTYLAQCHWYLALTQLERCDLAVLFGNSDFRIYHIERDRELEAILVDQAIDFWVQHVQADIPPKPQTLVDFQTLFHTEVAGKSIIASDETVQMIKEFHLLSEELNTKEEAIKGIKQNIMAQMGDAEKLTYQDQTLVTWKKPKASMRFDSKRFELERPELFPMYQTPIATSRRLVIKEWHDKIENINNQIISNTLSALGARNEHE